MSLQNAPHLARITPAPPTRAGRVLHPLWLVVQAVAMVGYSMAWVLLAIGGLMLASWRSPFDMVGWVMVSCSILWLTMIIGLMFTYPEWPHNLRLCRRLLRRLGQPNRRVVELVPRERWKKLCIDTATDLMTIEVDDHGVRMIGDRFCYELPSEAILGAQCESTTPPGWWCDSYLVVIVARTEDGTVELPISYRDHSFGSLRPSRRRAAAALLAAEVNRIARCDTYQPAPVPVIEPKHIAWSNNPYATF